MKKRVMIWTMVLCGMAVTGTVRATTANEYVQSGRLWLFQGTLIGFRNGHEVFNAGMNDPACPDCATSRELIFFHALSRMAMWTVRNDGAPTDSALELAEQNGFSVTGNWIRDLEITSDWQVNRYDAYDLPQNFESIVQDIASSLGSDGLTEINSVLEELDRITETPDNRFRIFLTPEETHAFMDPLSPPLSYNLEIDYADVLLLKGILSAVKASIHTLSAYDLNTANKEEILQKFYGECFSINNDLLLPNSDFGKVLPTAGNPANGTAILAQARQAWIEAITYYQLAMDSMEQENIPVGSDPQDDELFYIEWQDQSQNQKLKELLNQLLDSLQNDTIPIYIYSTHKIFTVQSDTQQTFGQIELTLNTLDEPETGTFTLVQDTEFPITWKLDYVEIQNLHLFAEMSSPSTEIIPEPVSCWGGGFIDGQINSDKTVITSLYISTWGQPVITVENLTATLQNTNEETLALDINPLLGSTIRYPNPVSPRDLLPEFNAWNTPLPSTVGHGLDDDSTLGGILPGKTHLDWNRLGSLQPAAHLDWEEIYPWQQVDGWVGFWLDEQLILEDAVGDLLWEEPDSDNVPGADIAALYMGYDLDYIHGEITCDGLLDNGYYSYNVKFSYCPTESDDLDALRVHIEIQNNSIQSAGLWHRVSDEYGNSYWTSLDTIEAAIEDNYIRFRIPWWMIPSYINGRYITIDSAWGYESGDTLAEDENPTQIQVGPAGTLSGTVSYNGFIGAPIYIQAYTDLYNPDESIVASTMIAVPGPYQLVGIGLGWEGYVRAFTPLFGLNITDLDAIAIESMVEASQHYPQVNNINLTLQNPPVLQQDTWMEGQLDEVSKRTGIFAFDAIEGAEYCFDLQPSSETYFAFSLHGRNGTEDIYETASYSSSIMGFCWTCPVSGRYYLKVENWDWYSDSADYQVRYSSDITCPFADISGPEWAGVRDCRVDFSDFALLADHWLQICDEPYWCDDSDYDKTNQVDAEDLAQLINEWLDSGPVI